MKNILIPISAFLTATALQAAPLLTDDFTGTTQFTDNNTVPTANIWHTDDPAQFGLNDASDSARRFLTGNFADIEAIAYATDDSVLVDESLNFTFTYDNTFDSVEVTYSLYGSPVGVDGFGGGGTRVRTDSITPGSEWVVLATRTETLSAGTGNKVLSWTHTGTNYTGVAVQIATFAITPGSGTYLDIQSVDVSAIPEPGTLALAALSALSLFLLRRFQK
jgi:hypothetical protein